MIFSWKIFQTEGTSSKKVLKQAKKCLTFEKQPEAIVERVRRVVRDGVKEVMVVGEIKCYRALKTVLRALALTLREMGYHWDF